MASNRDHVVAATSDDLNDTKHYTPPDGSRSSDTEAQPLAHNEKLNVSDCSSLKQRARAEHSKHDAEYVQKHAPTTQYLCKVVVSKDVGAFLLCLGMSLSATLLLRLNHLPARICEVPLAPTLSYEHVTADRAASQQDTWAPNPCITAFAIVWYIFGVLGGTGSLSSLGSSAALGWFMAIGISWGMAVGWWMGFTVVEALVFLVPWIPLASFVLLGCVHAVSHIRKQEEEEKV